MYADDIVTLLVGPPALAATEEIRLKEAVIDKFEGALEMELSRSRVPWALDAESKSLTLASSAKARRRIAPAMRKVGIAVAKLSENLGIDFQVGGKLGRVKQGMRVKEISTGCAASLNLAARQAPTFLERAGSQRCAMARASLA